MRDSIGIHDLRVQTRVGVTDEERASYRPVMINIWLGTDIRAAGRSDELADTIDYSTVLRRVSEMVGSGEFGLIEHIAERVASLLLQEIGADSVKVEIIKERPPVEQDVRAVSVTIERGSK